MKKYIVGVDIGGTKLAVVITDRKGKILKILKEPTPQEKTSQLVMERIIYLIKEVISLAKANLKEVVGIGICSPGPLNIKEGIVLFAPNLPGWENIPLKDLIKKAFNIPVTVENDANAAALGEKWFGAGRGKDNLIYLTVSTGIGGGIIIKGEIYHGANDGAGEVGHMTIVPEGPRCRCGRKGCLEALASGTSIARRAKEKIKSNSQSLILKLAAGNLENITAETVYQAARKKDRLGLEVIREAVKYLGIGVANIVKILNPEIVIIGGGVAKMGDFLFLPLREFVAEEISKVPGKMVEIVPAQLGDNVGTLGAVALVLQKYG